MFITLTMVSCASSSGENEYIIMDGQDTLAYFVRENPDVPLVKVYINKKYSGRKNDIRALVKQGLKTKKFMYESLEGVISCPCEIYVSKSDKSISCVDKLNYEYIEITNQFTDYKDHLINEFAFAHKGKRIVLDGIEVKCVKSEKLYSCFLTTKKLSTKQILYLHSILYSKDIIYYFFDKPQKEYKSGNEYASICYDKIYRFDTNEEFSIEDLYMLEDNIKYEPVISD